MNICYDTANHIVVERHTCAASLVEDIKYLLTLAEAIEECCGCTHIHSHTAVGQQVRRQTHKLVHHHADNLHTTRNLNTKCLLNAQAEAMTVLVSRHIVHTVGVHKCLRIRVRLAQLLNTAVDISRNRNHTAHGLSVNKCAQAHHTVCRRVLRTEVYHIILRVKEFIFLLNHLSVLLDVGH